MSFGPTGAWPCTHALPDAAPGPSWCWARPGLLYTNYFCALLLPALALFHLFFVRKERRWWQPVVLLGLAALLALPQVPDLLSGIEHNQEKDHLHAEALRYPEVIATFLRYLSNGLFEVRRPFSTLFAIALPLPLLYFVLHSRRSRQPPGAAWYLLLTGILLLLLLLGASEWLRVFEEKRVRYLVMLWLPSLLLISQAFMEPSRVNLRRAAGLALVALVALAGASDFLLEGELVRFSRLRSETAMSIAATRAIAAEGSDSGLLAVDRSGLFARFHRVYEFYTGSYGDRRVQLDQPAASNELMERAPGQDLVWLLASSSQEAALGVRAHLDHFRQEGWFHCRSSREAGVTLELLLPPFPAAMLDQARLHFENDVELFAPVAPELHDGLLRFRSSLGSADETLLARYSLAIHVMDLRTGERVAQADTGVGPGAYVPLCREIDISALPPGDYEAARRALRLADRRAQSRPGLRVRLVRAATCTRCIASASAEASEVVISHDKDEVRSAVPLMQYCSGTGANHAVGNARASRSAQLIWLWALAAIAAGSRASSFRKWPTTPFNSMRSLPCASPGHSIPGLGPLPMSGARLRKFPEQALGWPMLLSVWGHSAGWSELIVRAMPFFAGMLTIAWVYRTGRLFRNIRRSYRCVVAQRSVFFLAYMIHARAFTLVTLFATLCIWSYWRSPCTRSRQARARRQACCSAALACSIRTTSARYSCPRSACFICSSFPGTGAGGGPCSWSGLPPCSHPLNCRFC